MARPRPDARPARDERMEGMALGGLLCTHDVALLLGAFTGPHALSVAGAVAKAPHATVGALWPTLLATSPRCIYVVGGYTPEDHRMRSAERYNLASGAWEAAPPLGSCRGGAAAAAFGGRIYVCGGCVEFHVVLSSVEVFDPAAGAWGVGADLTVGRQGAAASVVGGELHVCGGWGEGDAPLTSVEALRRRGGKWRDLGPCLLEPRAWGAAGALGGELWLCGGQSRHEPLDSSERLDLSRGAGDGAGAGAGPRSRAGPRLLQRRSAPCAATQGGRLLVAGGWDEHRQNLRTVECLDPKVNCWEPVSPMLLKRFGAAACAASGHMFVFGGYEEDDVDACLTSTERLDADFWQWRVVAPMREPRSGAVAVAMWL